MLIKLEHFAYFVLRRYGTVCILFLLFPLASEFTVSSAVSVGQTLRYFSQS